MVDLAQITPLGNRILVRRDESKSCSRGGIILPEDSKTPTLTGIVLGVGKAVDIVEYPIQEYQRVIYHPSYAIPAELEKDNVLFIVDVEYVYGIISKVKKEETVEKE